MLVLNIPDEGHTVGCLLRNRLFMFGADFAACIVSHPQDKNLLIKVQGENCHEIIKDALDASKKDVNEMLKSVQSYIFHEELNNQEMTDD